MPEDQIYIMTQDCIPAVRNIQGEIAVDDSGHIIKKPHGHGDIHFCLFRVCGFLLFFMLRTILLRLGLRNTTSLPLSSSKIQIL